MPKKTSTKSGSASAPLRSTCIPVSMCLGGGRLAALLQTDLYPSAPTTTLDEMVINSRSDLISEVTSLPESRSDRTELPTLGTAPASTALWNMILSKSGLSMTHARALLALSSSVYPRGECILVPLTSETTLSLANMGTPRWVTSPAHCRGSPGVRCSSAITTSKSLAKSRAAVEPAGPPPTTNTSERTGAGGHCALFQHCRDSALEHFSSCTANFRYSVRRSVGT